MRFIHTLIVALATTTASITLATAKNHQLNQKPPKHPHDSPLLTLPNGATVHTHLPPHVPGAAASSSNPYAGAGRISFRNKPPIKVVVVTGNGSDDGDQVVELVVDANGGVIEPASPGDHPLDEIGTFGGEGVNGANIVSNNNNNGPPPSPHYANIVNPADNNNIVDDEAPSSSSSSNTKQQLPPPPIEVDLTLLGDLKQQSLEIDLDNDLIDGPVVFWRDEEFDDVVEENKSHHANANTAAANDDANGGGVVDVEYGGGIHPLPPNNTNQRRRRRSLRRKLRKHRRIQDLSTRQDSICDLLSPQDLLDDPTLCNSSQESPSSNPNTYVINNEPGVDYLPPNIFYPPGSPYSRFTYFEGTATITIEGSPYLASIYMKQLLSPVTDTHCLSGSIMTPVMNYEFNCGLSGVDENKTNMTRTYVTVKDPKDDPGMPNPIDVEVEYNGGRRLMSFEDKGEGSGGGSSSRMRGKGRRGLKTSGMENEGGGVEG